MPPATPAVALKRGDSSGGIVGVWVAVVPPPLVGMEISDYVWLLFGGGGRRGRIYQDRPSISPANKARPVCWISRWIRGVSSGVRAVPAMGNPRWRHHAFHALHSVIRLVNV